MGTTTNRRNKFASNNEMEHFNSAEKIIVPLDNQVEDPFLGEEFEWLSQWTKLNAENFDGEAKKSDTKPTKLTLHVKDVMKQSSMYKKQIHELNSQNVFLVKEMDILKDFEQQMGDLQLLSSQKEHLTIERDGLLLQIEEAKEKCVKVLQKLEEQGKTMQEMNNHFHRELAECERLRTGTLNALEHQDKKHLLEMERLEQNLENNFSELNTCALCVRPWDSDGVHRLVSLACGHLFGDKCIRDHLRHALYCPICKQAAHEHNLRYIYGRNIFPYEN
ncbi:E3 ubiquitin-protein ligase rnf8-B-like [Drosophila obscura]|uniref:E3 ubiquitin-protein ligase rnf8-B-like n=1 Tax=Drosophila obscura TaxID=7282 RepID=UPI000BA046DE|nr:E3 ubiquitin-protein ligase rnf8-B-like [Drosophila obscura]